MSDVIVPKGQPIPGDPEKKGWLFKWTNYLKGYQRRWFVLSNGLLSYYRYVNEINVFVSKYHTKHLFFKIWYLWNIIFTYQLIWKVSIWRIISFFLYRRIYCDYFCFWRLCIIYSQRRTVINQMIWIFECCTYD